MITRQILNKSNSQQNHYNLITDDIILIQYQF